MHSPNTPWMHVQWWLVGDSYISSFYVHSSSQPYSSHTALMYSYCCWCILSKSWNPTLEPEPLSQHLNFFRLTLTIALHFTLHFTHANSMYLTQLYILVSSYSVRWNFHFNAMAEWWWMKNVPNHVLFLPHPAQLRDCSNWRYYDYTYVSVCIEDELHMTRM